MTHAATTHPTFEDMKHAVYAVNKANGWFDSDREWGDELALLHSEVSEMFEAYRDHGYKDATITGYSDRDGEHEVKQPKPEGFGSEAADVLVRLLDMAYRYEEVTFPWSTLDDVPDAPNFKDEEDRSVGHHIAALHHLISQISSLDVNLTYVTIYLVTWCRRLNIDLQAEFDRKLAFNAMRGHRHGGKLV